MLLLNGVQFIPTGKNPDHEIQIKHYKESVKFLRDTYGKNGQNSIITLIRRKEPTRNATGMLEETAPLVFPAKAYPEVQFAASDSKKKDSIGGMETWAYSENRPLRKQAGDDYQQDPKSIKFMSHAQGFNMDTHIDLLYFLLYKSPKVFFPPAVAQGKVKKGDLMVEDSALRAKEAVAKERDILKLKNAIMAPSLQYPLHNDENLRKVAAAWGIDGAMDQHKSVDELRLLLEHTVKNAEKAKKMTGNGKGLEEFFELIEFDDSVRQRSMIMYALDNGKIKHDKDKNTYLYASGNELLNVPDNKKYVAFDYLASHLSNELNAKEWEMFIKEVVDEDYLNALNFGDLKWLAKLNELPLSQRSTEGLREDLSKIYCG